MPDFFPLLAKASCDIASSTHVTDKSHQCCRFVGIPHISVGKMNVRGRIKICGNSVG